MSKNKTLTKEFKAFLFSLGIANLATILLPISLIFYFELFVVKTLTDNDSQELTYSRIITSLLLVGVFVLIANIFTAVKLLKIYKLSKNQTRAAKILLALSVFLPIAYFAFVVAIRFI